MDQLNGEKESVPPGLKMLALLMIPGLFFSYQNVRVSGLTFRFTNWALDQETAALNDAPRPLRKFPSNAWSHPIPIEELVKYNVTCPPGLSPIENVHFPSSATHPPGRKIPKIIHITSRHRCATTSVIKNVEKWRFDNYSVYFHDDHAIEKLFSHPMTRSHFPTLREGLKCVTNGATKSDLWRYLVLYVYGGVYTDIDNSPTGFNGETIKATEDSFFVVEQLGIMSQFFLASSAGHPLMAKMLEVGVERLIDIKNVMVNNPAQTTGPGACKVGFINFMEAVGKETNGYVGAGTYVGMENRSVTVIGTKDNSKEYINRGGLTNGEKMEYYKALGIVHFIDSRKAFPGKRTISCIEHLKRTNGTDKVANYRFDENLNSYVEAKAIAKGKYNLTF